MPLIRCFECGNEVSDRASSCPKCGAPVQHADAVVAPAPKRSAFWDPKTNLKRLAIWSGVLALVGWFAYHFLLGREGRDAVNIVASKTVVGAEIIPWADRADSALRAMMGGQSAQVIATSIRRITHPSGESERLTDFEVRKVSDGLSVRFNVAWNGGILGTAYSTVVIWELNEHQHVRAVVTQDNGPFGVDGENKQRLEEYFRTEVYPLLISNLSR
jgi:zinc-ribbon domain